MAEQESLDQPNQTPFTSVVEHLQVGSGDSEQFDLAVRASLAKVRSYVETLGVGKQVTPEQTQMLYEHGFTLLKRELPSDLSLSFARQANTEVVRKDQETGHSIYEQPLVGAFNAAFAEEIGFDKEAAEILRAQPAEVLPTVDSAAKTDESDRELEALNAGDLTPPSEDPTTVEPEASPVEDETEVEEPEMSDEEATALKKKWLHDFIEMSLEQLKAKKIGEERLNPSTELTVEELERFRADLITEYAEMDLDQFKLRAEFLKDNGYEDTETSEKPKLSHEESNRWLLKHLRESRQDFMNRTDRYRQEVIEKHQIFIAKQGKETRADRKELDERLGYADKQLARHLGDLDAKIRGLEAELGIQGSTKEES